MPRRKGGKTAKGNDPPWKLQKIPTRMEWKELVKECHRLYGPDPDRRREGLVYMDPLYGEVKDIRHLAFIKLWEKVANGSIHAIAMVLDREMGRPQANVDMKVSHEETVVLEWPTHTATIEEKPAALRQGIDLAEDITPEVQPENEQTGT